ncbi:MAG: hypothetical protein AB1529_04215 [Candidatus Micrarchaeota archaeon]
MAFKTAAIFLMLLPALAFSQSAEDYCYSERVQGEACYQDCCESLGYSWSGGGCMVSDADQGYVSSMCDYCTDSYVQCVSDYESGLSGQSGGYSSSGGGCCAGAVLLSLIPLAVIVKR